ncbi:MAG TPA: T9SS type A sorting domain-containing protein, partial [Catalimonadaceae bacterium]|nr:T9SS type A sorting domain-containing protein [Catalimonadaceae bacterium]
EQSLAFFRLRPSDFIDVYVSTDCGSTYTILGRIDSLNQQVAAGFLPRDFPLDLYIGQNITVKLDAKLTPKAFSSVFLDISRFSIGLQVGNEELISGNNASVVLYPNPTSAQRGLSFHSSDLIRSATAYSVDGKRVLLPLQQGDSDKYEVETNRLSPGIYTLILDGQSAPVRLRFVVE